MSLDLQNKLKGLKDFNLDKEVDNIINAINEFRTANDVKRKITDKEKNQNVGSNGMKLGDVITFTGEIDFNVPVTDAKGKITSTYIGGKLDNGTYFSIKKLMGISSMRGYITTGELPHTTGKTEKDAKVVNIKAEVVEDFDFDNVFQPEDRNLFRFATMLKATNALENVSFRYVGTVIKGYEAKDKNPPEAFENWFAGAKRVMQSALFELV